jgi:23S rRNA (cytosine1962-C5)-methyltransferase
MNKNGFNYELIDSGDSRRLEKWSGVLVDRPAPQAVWPKNINCKDWEDSQIYFNKENLKWQVKKETPDNWCFNIDKISCKLKLSSNGQVGVFPEQLLNWDWINKRLSNIERPVKILNAFAYTGVATLVASASSKNIEVWHVDNAKSFITWARENASLSGLEDNVIHWVIEDVIKFLEREVKRGHKYDGLILDPPAFGRSKNKIWKLSKDLPRLVELMGLVLNDNPSIVSLSWHDSSLSSDTVLEMLDNLSQIKKRKLEVVDLIIPAVNGHDLPAGKCVRF